MAQSEYEMVEKDSKFIDEFIEISKYFGQRFDLIQASGGNSSVKDKNRMFIKSSGYSMAGMEKFLSPKSVNA